MSKSPTCKDTSQTIYFGIGFGEHCHSLVLIFWLGTFANKVGDDAVGGAVGAVVIVGIDGREAQMALIARGIGHAQVLIVQLWLPSVIQHPLQLLDVKQSRQTVADGAHDFAVLDRTGRINEHPAELLHVDAAVENRTL